jgi:hypothetical protein
MSKFNKGATFASAKVAVNVCSAREITIPPRSSKTNKGMLAKSSWVYELATGSGTNVSK